MVRIIEPRARIDSVPNRTAGIALLQKCEGYARLSHRSEDKQTADSWERLLRSVVLEHGDWSVTEHEKVTVFVLCDRGISHEWVRHRIGAYTQESTRFVNYQKKFGELEFVCPFNVEAEDEEQMRLKKWLTAMECISETYFDLLGCGVSPQIARSVLPNALATRLWVTYNLRNWRHFLIMRTCKEAHPQMRKITIPLLKEFQEKIPLLYDDIVPEEKQSVGMSKAR